MRSRGRYRNDGHGVAIRVEHRRLPRTAVDHLDADVVTNALEHNPQLELWTTPDVAEQLASFGGRVHAIGHGDAFTIFFRKHKFKAVAPDQGSAFDLCEHEFVFLCVIKMRTIFADQLFGRRACHVGES